MNSTTSLAALSIVAIALLPVACGKKKPAQNASGASTGYYGGNNPNGTQPGPTTTAPAQTTAPTATATQAPPPASTQPAATNPALQTMMTPLLQVEAKQFAKWMRPQGDTFAGMLQEGQSIEQIVMLNPGKCYTVVGQAVPGGIQELDIKVMAIAPLPNAPPLAVMAQDNMQGPQAVVAPTPNCYKYALPLPAQVKIVVKAVKGSGAAGARLYVK